MPALITLVALLLPLLAGCSDQAGIDGYAAQVRANAGTMIPREENAVLLFVHAGCPACLRMVKAVARQGEATDWYVVMRTPDEGLLYQVRQYVPSERVILDPEGDIGRLLRVEKVPSTVFLKDGLRVLLEEWPRTRHVSEYSKLLAEFSAGRYLPPPAIAVSPGDTLTGWKVKDALGGPVDLGDLRGPALITFFSGSCAACNRQLPVMEKLASEHDLTVFLVQPDDDEGAGTVGATSGLQALIDEQRQVFLGLGISATPTNVIIDRNGVVIWADVGYREDFEQVYLLLKREYLSFQLDGR